VSCGHVADQIAMFEKYKPGMEHLLITTIIMKGVKHGSCSFAFTHHLPTPNLNLIW